MIYLYSGTPGSGKSYSATAQIWDALYFRRNPIPVICNYELNVNDSVKPYFHYKPNSELTPDFLVDFAERWWSDPKHSFHENALLFVVDECQ